MHPLLIVACAFAVVILGFKPARLMVAKVRGARARAKVAELAELEAAAEAAAARHASPPRPMAATYPPTSILILLEGDDGEPTDLEYAIRDSVLPVLQRFDQEVLSPGHIVPGQSPDGRPGFALVVTYCPAGLAPIEAAENFNPAAALAALPRLDVVSYEKTPKTPKKPAQTGEAS